MLRNLFFAAAAIVVAQFSWTSEVSSQSFGDYCADKCPKLLGVPSPTCVSACVGECGLFAAYTNALAGACVSAAHDDSNRSNAREARELLIRYGLFSSGDFNGVSVRFCDIGGCPRGVCFGASGMVPRRNLIIIDDSLGNVSGKRLAPILGHEMIHIKQFRRWGSAGFQCRYGQQLSNGRKFARGNFIEDEAYNFEDRVVATLRTPLPLQMRWSYAGPVSGMNCLQFLEPADPHTWNDNFLCFDRAIEARWSFAGPIGGMRCTQIDENADRAGTWTDNYLCVPRSSPHRFWWTSAGEPRAGCVKIHEPSEPPQTTWNDNFLCVQ